MRGCWDRAVTIEGGASGATASRSPPARRGPGRADLGLGRTRTCADLWAATGMLAHWGKAGCVGQGPPLNLPCRPAGSAGQSAASSDRRVCLTRNPSPPPPPPGPRATLPDVRSESPTHTGAPRTPGGEPTQGSPPCAATPRPCRRDCAVGAGPSPVRVARPPHTARRRRHLPRALAHGRDGRIHESEARVDSFIDPRAWPRSRRLRGPSQSPPAPPPPPTSSGACALRTCSSVERPSPESSFRCTRIGTGRYTACPWGPNREGPRAARARPDPWRAAACLPACLPPIAEPHSHGRQMDARPARREAAERPGHGGGRGQSQRSRWRAAAIRRGAAGDERRRRRRVFYDYLHVPGGHRLPTGGFRPAAVYVGRRSGRPDDDLPGVEPSPSPACPGRPRPTSAASRRGTGRPSRRLNCPLVRRGRLLQQAGWARGRASSGGN